eukprot:2268311-Pleurochrysis_carterae.AAC.1
MSVQKIPAHACVQKRTGACVSARVGMWVRECASGLVCGWVGGWAGGRCACVRALASPGACACACAQICAGVIVGTAEGEDMRECER